MPCRCTLIDCPQYQVLVEFLEDVERLARDHDDQTLADMVTSARGALADVHNGS